MTSTQSPSLLEWFRPSRGDLARGFLLHGLFSALVGVAIAFLMTLGRQRLPSLDDVAAGALIGFVINSVFVVYGLVVRLLPKAWSQALNRYLSTRVGAVTLGVPIFFVGGVVGFLIGNRLSGLLLPNHRLGFGGPLLGWLLFMGLVSIIVGSLLTSIETNRKRLIRSAEQLKEQEFAQKELELARTIQKRLLPPPEVEGPGFRVAARNRAAQVVAGDFYDVFRLDDGDLGLVVGDVAGKGLGASLIMASVKAMLPLVAVGRSVAGTLEELNRRLAADLPGREFVALAYARYSPGSGRLELANAGLPDPYVLRPDAAPRPVAPSGSRFPLGVRPETRYESLELGLSEGEWLLVFSDGLAERRGGADEPLGYDALVELFPPRDAEPGAWIDALFERLEAIGEVRIEDDWTALVLQPEWPLLASPPGGEVSSGAC